MRYTEADPMAERSYAQQLNDTSANNGEQQATGIRQRYRTFYRAEDISFFLRNFFSESTINHHFSLFTLFLGPPATNAATQTMELQENVPIIHANPITIQPGGEYTISP